MAWVAQSMVFLMPAIGAIALFTFLAVVGWAAERRRERETYYRYEFRKRLVESGQMSGADLRELQRYETETEAHTAAQNRRQRMLAGGMIIAGAGLGLLFGLRFVEGEPVWMVGYIPLFIGLAMLLYALVAAPRNVTPMPPARPPQA